MTRSKISFVLILLCFGLFAQKQVSVIVDLSQQRQLNLVDSSRVSAEIQRLLKSYWQDGYLFAGIDSLVGDTYYLHRGKIINLGTNEESLQTWKKAITNAEAWVKGMADKGYPFAKYAWDSLNLDQELLRYKVRLDSGPFVRFDSLILLNEIKTDPDFITRTLGIDAKSIYRESAYRTIAQKMDRISFLSLNRPPDISFENGNAWTYLDIKESSTGSFQGILGVLPNQATGKGALITGNLDLSLLNLFRSGKELNFSWAQFAEKSQRLETSYRHPFIAGTSLHLNLSFKLFKQDTSFLNRETSLSGSFYISPKLEMGFGYKSQNATVLTTQISLLSERNWLDFNQDWYFWQLRKGNGPIIRAGNSLIYSSDLAIGRRIVRRNALFPQELYDTVKMNTTNYKWEAQAQLQRNLAKQSYLFGSLSIAHLSNSASANQLYRVGGLQTFRGFNEQFFYTPTYLITQVEGRLFFEEQSYIFIFYDQGFLKNRDWSNPFGLGAGFSLLTNSGLFSFAMAVGKTEAIPFELTNMKIHFGYLSTF